MLDEEEIAALRTRLGTVPMEDFADLAELHPARLLIEVAKLRLPFIRMMSDIAGLLGDLETSVRGNVRFVVFRDAEVDLQVDFGPQMRSAMAKALNEKFLVDHDEQIATRSKFLQQQVRIVGERARPGRVRRRDEIGRMLDERAQLRPGPEAFRDQWLAEKFTHETLELHPADHGGLREVLDGLEGLQRLLKRLVGTKIEPPSTASSLQKEVNRLVVSIRSKMNAAPLAVGYPLPRRSLTDTDLARVRKAIDDLREAIFVASEYSDALNDLYDFFNLQIWRQRWRIYELWVLARIAAHLFTLGAIVSDTTRIVNGAWKLKFTKDSSPVLGLELAGAILELYYQFYQGRADTGDMPDIAVRMRNGRFIAVVDPKQGYSYSRNDLNNVCVRYAEAFQPLLSCVCNYYPVRQAEILRRNPDAVVLYGLSPEDDDVVNVFTTSLTTAIETAYAESGLPIVRSPNVLVLFDGSGSANSVRERLLERLRAEVVALETPPTIISRALIFTDDVVREGRLAELLDGSMLAGVSGGTDLGTAVRSALARLARLAPPRKLWIFTDGQGLDSPTDLVTDLESIGHDVVLVEAGQCNLSPLAQAIGGRHVQI